MEAQGDYARLHTADGSHLVRIPLAQLEERWANAGFVRIHRSYLVALPLVSELRMTANGYAVVIGTGDGAKELPVSRTAHQGAEGTDRATAEERLVSRHDAGKPEDSQPARRGSASRRRKPRRRRVVLADSTKSRGKALRTIVELEEQTSVGEKLVRDLIRQQLQVGVRARVRGAVRAVPAPDHLLPVPADRGPARARRRHAVARARPRALPASSTASGVVFRRRAERHERDFVNMVDR